MTFHLVTVEKNVHKDSSIIPLYIKNITFNVNKSEVNTDLGK